MDCKLLGMLFTIGQGKYIIGTNAIIMSNGAYFTMAKLQYMDNYIYKSMENCEF